MSDNRKKVQHLFLRAGFGETISGGRKKANNNLQSLVDGLFIDAEKYRELDIIDAPRTDSDGKVSPLQLPSIILKSRAEMERFNVAWMDRMAEKEGQLRERMTFFWHNHFATSTTFAYLMQVQNNTLRFYALGSFRKMLHAIAKDPAMIIYLNNQQNKKKQPNENFAREVMELFTLGRGNYTENDIKEAARAFTGWQVDMTGFYKFNEKQHDFDSKTVFGKTGNFDGGDIIDMLLEKRQTARYVCTKLFREFVSEFPDKDIIDQMTKVFYESDYDIGKLMRFVFSSSWFYEDRFIGCKIASPVDLLVRYRRLNGMYFTEQKAQLEAQKVLGQVLLFPPNVAGWKGGRNWIDSSSLLIRLSIPKVMLDGTGLDLRAKPQFEEEGKPDAKKVKMKVDWNRLIDQLKGIPDDEIESELRAALIQAPDDRIDKGVLRSQIDRSSRDKRIVSTAVALMSTPEFQLI